MLEKPQWIEIIARARTWLAASPRIPPPPVIFWARITSTLKNNFPTDITRNEGGCQTHGCWQLNESAVHGACNRIAIARREHAHRNWPITLLDESITTHYIKLVVITVGCLELVSQHQYPHRRSVQYRIAFIALPIPCLHITSSAASLSLTPPHLFSQCLRKSRQQVR